MKKKYKALILDLDGTTVPNHKDGMPSEKVRKAIAKAKNKIHICVATGRPMHMAKPILDHLELSGPVIVLDGTLIIDPVTKKILVEHKIGKKDIEYIVKLCEERKIRLFIDNRETSFKYKKGMSLDGSISAVAIDMTLEQVEALHSSLQHIPTITSHKIVSWIPGKTALSITHASATKLHGILEVARMQGISTHEIIGVGDGYNDFPLLMACGLKVAMGNAVPELKEIADYIAPTVDEDGVADVIEKFVL